MSVSSTSTSASTRWATSAARRSLSPKRISSSAMASFSLTTGTHAELEQALQRLAGVEVLARGRRSRSGVSSTWPATTPCSASDVVVHPHEPALADRRHRLQRRHVGGRVAGEPERGHAGGDRARASRPRPGGPPARRPRHLGAQLRDRARSSISPRSSVIDDVPILATTISRSPSASGSYSKREARRCARRRRRARRPAPAPGRRPSGCRRCWT